MPGLRKAKQKYLLEKQRRERRNNRYLDRSQMQCAICLESVSSRGILSVCDHWFCFDCIYEWSRNTNTCPLCKERFRCITKYTFHTNSPEKVFRIKDKNISVANIHEDDYEVAMGIALNDDESFIESDDSQDETFHPDTSDSEYNTSVRVQRVSRNAQRRSINRQVIHTGIPSSSRSTASYMSSELDSHVSEFTETSVSVTSPKFQSTVKQGKKKRKKRRKIVMPKRKLSSVGNSKPRKQIDRFPTNSSANMWIDMSAKKKIEKEKKMQYCSPTLLPRDSVDEPISFRRKRNCQKRCIVIESDCENDSIDDTDDESIRSVNSFVKYDSSRLRKRKRINYDVDDSSISCNSDQCNNHSPVVSDKVAGTSNQLSPNDHLDNISWSEKTNSPIIINAATSSRTKDVSWGEKSSISNFFQFPGLFNTSNLQESNMSPCVVADKVVISSRNNSKSPKSRASLLCDVSPLSVHSNFNKQKNSIETSPIKCKRKFKFRKK